MQKINDILTKHLEGKSAVNAEFAKNIDKALERATDAFKILCDLKQFLVEGKINEAMEIFRDLDDGRR